jgi:hypothetical protein
MGMCNVIVITRYIFFTQIFIVFGAKRYILKLDRENSNQKKNKFEAHIKDFPPEIQISNIIVYIHSEIFEHKYQEFCVR